MRIHDSRLGPDLHGMMKRLIFSLLTIIPLMSCAANDKNIEPVVNADLMKFAYANCLFQYFKKKGFDTSDIRGISGGFVEKSSVSAEKFQEIAIFLATYEPDLASKNNIDIDLYKCFHLEKSIALQKIITN